MQVLKEEGKKNHKRNGLVQVARTTFDLTCLAFYVPLLLLILPIQRIKTKYPYDFKSHFFVACCKFIMRKDINTVRALMNTMSFLGRPLIKSKADRNGYWIGPEIDFTDPDSIVIYYFHGGGFVFGDALQYGDSMNEMLALFKKTGRPCRIFSLEYPLAPENSYPAALNMAIETYEYLLDRVNPKQITVMGDR